MSEFAFTRRTFVSASALAGAAAGMAAAALPYGAAPAARAEEASSADATVDTINSSGIVVDPSKVTEVITSDVLVVGAGFSGLAASVQAALNGDSVITLEAQSVVGGNGQGVEGTFGVDTKWQQEQGIEVDKSVIMQEELGKTQWCVNGLYYKDLIQNSAANLEWAIEQGCEFSGTIDNYPFGANEGKVETFHWWKDGAAYQGYILPLNARALELGVDIRLNNRGLEFSYDESGAVDGVYATDAFGDLVNYKARAVILATGGFGNDDARIIRNGFDLDYLERIGTPGHYGDGINMALAADCAEFTGVCYLKYNRISHNYDIETFGPFYGAFCSGGQFLWLNDDLERFVDEGCAMRVGNAITQSAPIHNQNCHCFSIFDSQVYAEQLEAFADQAAEWGDDLSEQMEQLIADGDDVWRADTLEELAEAAGIDAEALVSAVDEYNAACEAGKDDWYGKDAEYMRAIKTAPFYLACIHVAMEGPLGGVKTGRDFRPMLNSGGCMDNVFVIGLDGIMLYRDVYPIDVPGSASAECLNGGRVSANEAHKVCEAAGPMEAVEVASDDRTNAKQVIMAVGDLLATMDLGLTDADSPATISMDDAAYAGFFDAVKAYKKVASLELTSCTVEATIKAVLAATARADSQQTNYRFTITSVEMTVNGAEVTYTPDDGIQVK